MPMFFRRLGLRLLAAGLALSLCAPLRAAEAPRSLASKTLGAERAFQVQLPDSYAHAARQRYPLLVVLDAQPQFEHVAGNVRFLANQGEIPELIVVGVASGKRVHDYTQTDWPQAWAGGGGAAKFKRFIADELLPSLARDYRVSGERLLLGHSAAGQFALHVLATEPALFDAYIVTSPSLDWDAGLPVRELEAGFRARERLPAFVYVAEDLSLGGVLTDQLALRRVLQTQAPRGLQAEVVAYPKERHASVVLPGAIDGLRARYLGHRLPPDDAPVLAEISSTRGIDALGLRFAQLAHTGRSATIPEEAFIDVAEAHLRRGEVSAAVALLRRAVQAWPDSKDCREALAQALKKLADAPVQAPASR